VAVHGGATNRFLASRPMVGVGLISYSLYLWHWPLLAFYRATGIADETRTKLLLCGVAVLLAMASYRFVEQPFRRMRFHSGRTVVEGACASVLLALSACALAIPSKSVAAADDQLAVRAENDRLPLTACRNGRPEQPVPRCPDPDARIAVWGDSMAMAWRPAFQGRVVEYVWVGCAPLIGYMPKQRAREANCRDFNSKVPAKLRGMDTVYLIAHWEAQRRLSDLQASLAAVAPHVRRVVVLGPTPTLRYYVPKCLRTQGPSACGMPRAEFDKTGGRILAEIRRYAAPFPNVEVLDVSDYFCTALECPAVRDGVPLYYDTHHPTVTAVKGFAFGERRVAY
jgi:hypothetical protein